LKNKVKIIAEGGLNHNGNFDKLIKLIKIAKNAEADFVKFQLFKTENFINKKFNNNKLDYKKIFSRFKSLEFSINDWKKAIKFGKKIGIKVIFSIFDKESIKILKNLGINIVKIPSGEINNYDLLKKVNYSKLKVILSTGMSGLNEISKAIEYLNKCEIILLHCVSEYPTTNPNLDNIDLLKKKFKKKIGFSDHTADVVTPALSVIAGAKVIEKHFTYNKKQKLGDHRFSLSPTELKIMVKNVRLAELSKGNKKRKISKKERKLQLLARKGIYFRKDKFKGEKIKYSDLIFLRPQGKLAIDKLNFIKGKILKKNVKSYISPDLNYFKK
tara:strand:- start:1948 stop:2931 length:984 start_codon:yes stop_codon:yes gene_type:complete